MSSFLFLAAIPMAVKAVLWILGILLGIGVIFASYFVYCLHESNSPDENEGDDYPPMGI